jgi:outer membrane receptor protein involved in Fe transport
MKKLLSLLPAVLFATTGYAQNAAAGGPAPSISIKGIAIDSATGQPMSFVTVTLQAPQSGKAIKKVVTKSDGTFVVKVPAGNAYSLALTFVGYAEKTVPISSGTADIDAGQILLVRSATRLKEASVTAARPIVSREVDRLSYDVQADPEAVSLSALEMMRKVPLLSLDANDNVLLNGGGNYKILINGRESAMFARNPTDVLRAMPAANIEKIEVITTPPAKYDAEGLSGIINIITKRHGDEGYNIGLNGAYHTFYGPNGGVNATYKQGKFGLAFFGFYGFQPNRVTNSSTTEYIPSIDNTITQNSINSKHAPVEDGSIDLSYEFDSLNLLTFSANLYQNTTYTGRIQTSATDSAGVMQQGYGLLNSYQEEYLGINAGFNYQLGFKRSKKALLTISYEFTAGPDEKVIIDSFFNRTNYDPVLYPNFHQYNNENIAYNTVQIDYAGPLSKRLSTEAGAKAIFRNDYSHFHENDLDSASHEYLPNLQLTNDFNYFQDVYSLYNSYQLNLNKWTAKGGLRLEHTVVNANFTSDSVSISPNYSNLIPSISIQRDFKAYSLNFGYTQRIQRPGISQLSPYVNLSNPLFIVTGNPSLRPELDNTFEATYNRFGKNSFIAGVSYAFSTNSIQRVSSLQTDGINGIKDTVNYTTNGNIGVNRNLGVNLNIRLNPGPAFSMGINARLGYLWFKGTYNGTQYSNQGTTGFASVNARYKWNIGYAVGLNGGYSSGSVTLQGHSEGRASSNVYVSKDVLKKKGTVAVVGSNVYSKYLTLSSVSGGPDFSQVSYNQSYYRSFSIRFNYRFGKLNSEIKKNQHGINNDDIKSGD